MIKFLTEAENELLKQMRADGVIEDTEFKKRANKLI